MSNQAWRRLVVGASLLMICAVQARVVRAAEITADVVLTSVRIVEHGLGTGGWLVLGGDSFSFAMGTTSLPSFVFEPGSRVSIHMQRTPENIFSARYRGAAVSGSPHVSSYAKGAMLEYSLTSLELLPLEVVAPGQVIQVHVVGTIVGWVAFEYPETLGARDLYRISFSGTISDMLGMRRARHPLPRWEIALPLDISTEVPEPGTLTMLAIGVAGAAAVRRWRR